MEARLIRLQRYAFVLPYLGFTVLATVLFFRAWVAEDAYITFRVIDNFLHGYGLRWNIHERVQVYTHPLWLLLQIPVAAALGNVYLASIALSLACSWSAIWIAMRSVRKPPLFTCACFLLPLYMSKAFMDYGTSGLENALSYLLFAVFAYVMLNKSESRYYWLYISLTVALALLNRLDVALIYLPVVVYLTIERFTTIRWRQVLLGATPLLAWFAFSLFYYGFLFPNTKYAKLGTGMAWSLYVNQGFNYLKHLMVLDLPGAMLLACSLVFLLPAARSRLSIPVGLPHLAQSFAAGVLIYTIYIINIGGDYMGGRFWAMPIFVSVWMIYAFLPSRTRPDMMFGFACLLVTGFLIVEPLGEIRKNCKDCMPVPGKIMDATFTFRGNRLVKSRWPLTVRTEGQYRFAQDGKKLAEQDEVHAQKMFFIGMSGYYAGPKAPLVDELGLADPLIARLPAVKKQRFFIGHFRRAVPKGYYYAIETGSLERMLPPIAAYYDKLRLITSGDLLSAERLKTIILFNFGAYDHYKEEYLRGGK